MATLFKILLVWLVISIIVAPFIGKFLHKISDEYPPIEDDKNVDSDGS